MVKDITQRIIITPKKVEQEGNGIVITDEKGDTVIINLNWENAEESDREEMREVVNEFAETAESFHTDYYRYKEF